MKSKAVHHWLTPIQSKPPATIAIAVAATPPCGSAVARALKSVWAEICNAIANMARRDFDLNEWHRIEFPNEHRREVRATRLTINHWL